ncbi:polysaccharide deacetylase family protein [uncultured Friedmanniella sp.]|uniref:polysaccharide deacetylase family protein n=1 Tax=uncultured Friedmanniella sp. TaxID=335381 RepID=UPI0035C9AC2A
MRELRARLGPGGRVVARQLADLALAPGFGSINAGSSPGSAALTFDDGPDPGTTPLILRALEGAGARATYFLLVSQAERHPELVREIRDSGHEIALHGFDHTPLPSLPHRAAVRVLNEARLRLEDVAQVRVSYYRPPYGKQTPTSWLAARRAGLEVVVWSADAADWEDLELLEHVDQAFARLTEGGILLLHERLEPGPDGSPVFASVDRAALTTAILDELEIRRLSAVTVSELVEGGAVRTAWFRR